MIKNKAQKPHYVDNKKFLEAMVEYRARCTNAEEQKEKKQMQIKSKLIANAGAENMMDQLAGDDKVYQSQMLDFLQRNAIKEEEPKKEKTKK